MFGYLVHTGVFLVGQGEVCFGLLVGIWELVGHLTRGLWVRYEFAIPSRMEIKLSGEDLCVLLDLAVRVVLTLVLVLAVYWTPG